MATLDQYVIKDDNNADINISNITNLLKNGSDGFIDLIKNPGGKEKLNGKLRKIDDAIKKITIVGTKHGSKDLTYIIRDGFHKELLIASIYKKLVEECLSNLGGDWNNIAIIVNEKLQLKIVNDDGDDEDANDEDGGSVASQNGSGGADEDGDDEDANDEDGDSVASQNGSGGADEGKTIPYFYLTSENHGNDKILMYELLQQLIANDMNPNIDDVIDFLLKIDSSWYLKYDSDIVEGILSSLEDKPTSDKEVTEFFKDTFPTLQRVRLRMSVVTITRKSEEEKQFSDLNAKLKLFDSLNSVMQTIRKITTDKAVLKTELESYFTNDGINKDYIVIIHGYGALDKKTALKENVGLSNFFNMIESFYYKLKEIDRLIPTLNEAGIKTYVNAKKEILTTIKQDLKTLLTTKTDIKDVGFVGKTYAEIIIAIFLADGVFESEQQKQDLKDSINDIVR